jgi:hypothetical protein
MSNKKKQIDDSQMSIFTYLRPEAPPSPGSMNISIRIRQAVSNAIRKSGKDRIDICAEIYKLTGIEVPKSTLDNWSAESRDRSSDLIDHNGNKRWGMSVEIAPAFCHICDDWEVLFIQAEAGNYKALKGKDVVRARMGLLKEEIAKKAHELKELEKKLLEAGE